MLDILSEGRLNFGVGKGAFPQHYQGFQLSMEDMRERSRARRGLELFAREVMPEFQ